MPATILVINGQPSQATLIEGAIGQLGYRVIAAKNSEDAVSYVDQHKQPQPTALLLDTTISGEYLHMIRDVKAHCPQLPVIAIVHYGDNEQAAEAAQAGANDFLPKPVMKERLKICLRNAVKMQHMSHHIMRLERMVTGHVTFPDIIGKSAVIHQAMERAKQTAQLKTPVWIRGESGAGKEFFARAIHGYGSGGNPFVAVQCGNVPGSAAEAIVLGRHQQACSLPSALNTLRSARCGTLFLKECGMLSPAMQLCLLEFFKEISKASNADNTGIRLIFTSAIPIESLVEKKQFHPLLYPYFHAVSLFVPSLRERKEDISLLAEHFTALYSASENKAVCGLTTSALDHLTQAAWPGNVRQLAHLLWRAVLMCDHEHLDTGDIRLMQQFSSPYPGNIRDAVLPLANPLLFNMEGQMRDLKSIEEEILRLALRHADGCMARAARSLGIGRSTLYRRIAEREEKIPTSLEKTTLRVRQ